MKCIVSSGKVGNAFLFTVFISKWWANDQAVCLPCKLGLDQILDMGGSMTNVFGNSIAAALVSRWEKALR